MIDIGSASEAAIDRLNDSLNPDERTLVIVRAGDLRNLLALVESQRYELARHKGLSALPWKGEEKPYRPLGLVRALHESLTERAD